MSKIKLGDMPKTFKPFPVKFPMPDGTEGVIEATFKYRTRKQFGKLLNDMYAAAGKDKPAESKIDFESLFADAGAKTAEHIFLSLDAWSLDEALSVEALAELADTLPAGAAALMTAYSAACNEGRLGN